MDWLPLLFLIAEAIYPHNFKHCIGQTIHPITCKYPVLHLQHAAWHDNMQQVTTGTALLPPSTAGADPACPTSTGWLEEQGNKGKIM